MITATLWQDICWLRLWKPKSRSVDPEGEVRDFPLLLAILSKYGVC